MEVEINTQTSNILKSGERFVPGITVSNLTKAYHVSRYRFAQQYVEHKRALDCGCGVGYGTAILAEQAETVIGGDLSYPTVRYAGERYRDQSSLDYLQFDCRQLPFGNNSYDAVVCFELIEHILEQNLLLQEIKRVLTDEGIAVISTPDREAYNAFIGAPNPFHTKELSREEFQYLLQKHFNQVTIYWQTLKSPYLELYHQSIQINDLRNQLESLKRTIRKPWLFLSRSTRFRKLFLSLKNRQKRSAEVDPMSTHNYDGDKHVYPLPSHLTFDMQRDTNSVYMVAVCQSKRYE